MALRMLLYLSRIIVSYTRLAVGLRIRISISCWRNTRRFSKVLRKEGLPRDLIEELTILYSMGLRKKLRGRT